MNKDFTRRTLLRVCAYSTAYAGLQTMAGSTFAQQPKRKIGVALLGLGHYAETQLAPALQLTEHCELRGIVTGSPDKIPQWQKQYNIPDKNVYSYETLPQIANNPDIDVVYVVTPTFLHKKYTVMAAEAGKHVWCEKPMAMTVEECQAMIDACNKNKVKLAIGYRLQHEPDNQTIMKFAKTQPYGPIQSLIAEAGYGGSGAPEGDWRMDRSKGGGALYDMGVYPINALRYATGLEPVAITAEFPNDMPEVFKHADATVFFTLEFPNGIKGDGKASVVREFNRLRVNAKNGWYKLEPFQSYSGVKGVTSDGKVINEKIQDQQAKQMDDEARLAKCDWLGATGTAWKRPSEPRVYLP